MRHRWGGALTLTLFATGLAVGVWPSPARAAVLINGAGTYSIDQLINPWSEDLFGAREQLSFNYRTPGTYVGLDQLARGQVDFAVAAAEPLPGQLGATPTAFLRAPIRADAQALVAMFGRNGLQTLTFGPEDEFGDREVTVLPYTGPVRLEPGGVAAAFSFPPGTGTIWGLDRTGDDNDIPRQLVFDLAEGQIINRESGTPEAAVVRGDPSSSNLYMQQYIESTTPERWRELLGLRNLPIATEPAPQWLFPNAPGRRSGTGGQLQILRELKDPSTENTSTASGVFALVPVSAAVEELTANRAQRAAEDGRARTAGDFRIIELRNGAGEWVAPDEQSILTALQAGNGAPLHGLDEAVPGAWPLSHLDYLYAPATGLTPEKTNGVAALIRYAVTKGQDHVQPFGTPRLPQQYVTQALAVANELVAGNCRQVGYEVREGPPGPLLPENIVVPGTIKHCVQSPAPQWPNPEISVDDDGDAAAATPPSTTVPSTQLATTTTSTTTTIVPSNPQPSQTTRATTAAAGTTTATTAARASPSAAPSPASATTTTSSLPSPTTTTAGASPSVEEARAASFPLPESVSEDADLAAAAEQAAAIPDDRLVALELPLPPPESERQGQHRAATLFMGAGLVTLLNNRWRRHLDRRSTA